MRLIKLFGLAAVAVCAFMAFIGVTAASAVTSLEEVVLCKTLEDPCAANNHFLSGTVLHGKSVNTNNDPPTLLGLKNLTCAGLTFLAETSSLLAHGLITAHGWSSCEAEGEACEVKALNLPYLFLFLLTDDHKSYHVVIEKHASSAGRPSFLMACENGTDCRYGESVLLYDVLHSGASKLVVLDVLQKLSGEGICSFTSGLWHALYELKCLSGGSEVGCWPAMHASSKL